ncbi:hypothetical protein IDJ76_12840 [Mucilaginibacter sp. ZB1P21]|uniref:Uncharacterized protein n=1 Tax=Mucilaginibacter glaciei TaxID=2772109 RepID=A0A926NY38_9SPHI|nr:hypothetical protein [Mucilaginibacter glaciei]
MCERRKYGSKEKLKECLELVVEIQKMIFAFREHIMNGSD